LKAGRGSFSRMNPTKIKKGAGRHQEQAEIKFNLSSKPLMAHLFVRRRKVGVATRSWTPAARETGSTFIRKSSHDSKEHRSRGRKNDNLG